MDRKVRVARRVRVRRGQKMVIGKGGRIVNPSGGRGSKVTLLGTFPVRGEKVAVFSSSPTRVIR